MEFKVSLLELGFTVNSIFYLFNNKLYTFIFAQLKLWEEEKKIFFGLAGV